MKSGKAAAGIAVVIGVATLVGCTGKQSGPPENTAVVKGTVTYNGSPLADATVTFQAADSPAKIAFGRTDASGNYQLSTAAGPGAIPGEYQISVTKMEASAASQVTEDSPEYTGETETAEAQSVIPEKYGKAATSELTASVKEGENTIPLTLTD